MALTPDQEVGSIRNHLERMRTENIQEVIKYAQAIIEGRNNQRRRELWGNVVAAIQKYENEIEPVQILINGDDDDYAIVGFDKNGGIILDTYPY